MSLTNSVWRQLHESGDGFRVPRTHDGKGVLITNVLLASPAEKSGIKALDVVTHVDKIPVSSSHDLLSIVGLKIGAPIQMHIQRCVPVVIPGSKSTSSSFNVEEHILKGTFSLSLNLTVSSRSRRIKFLFASKNPNTERKWHLAYSD